MLNTTAPHAPMQRYYRRYKARHMLRAMKGLSEIQVMRRRREVDRDRARSQLLKEAKGVLLVLYKQGQFGFGSARALALQVGCLAPLL